jgi:O-antigen ligase
VTAIEWLALSGAALVLVLLLYRPPVGLLALICFYPFNGWVPRLPVPGLNSETLLFGVGLALTLIRFGFRVPPFRYTGPLLAYLGVLVMAWAIGSVASHDFYGASLGTWELFKQLKALAFPTLFFMLAYFWFPERDDRRRALNAVAIAVFLTAAAGVGEFLLSYGAAIRGHRIESLFGNPNGLGAYLAAFGLVPLYLMRAPEASGKAKLFYLTTYGVAQIAIVLTLSRTAWLGTTAGHAVWFAYVNRQMLVVGATAMILALTVAFPFLPGFVQDRISKQTFEQRQVVFQVAGGLSGGGADRIVYYYIAGDMFLESPIWGHGLESFYLLTPKYGAKYGLLKNKAPHSLFVKLGSETGLIGLGVFFWIALTVLLCALRLRRTPGGRDLGSLLLASAICLFVNNLFTNSFLSGHQVSALFWLLLAVSVRELEAEDEEEDELEEEEPQRVWVPAYARLRTGPDAPARG